MGINTETYNQTMCRELETLEHSELNGVSPSNPSQVLVIYAEEKRLQKARGSRWLGNRHNRTDAHVSS